MAQFNSVVKTFDRISTGISGFDTLLKGGILKGGTYLLMGPPGSGKTIIANQMAFNYVARGAGGALYVTMLAESHGRLFGNMKPFDFFDESVISSQVNYISAYQILEKDGLDGLIRSLAALVRKNRAGLLFIDGIASVEGLSKTPVSFKKFVHDLNTVLSTSGCTAFLLSSLDGSQSNPEHTMVDGIFSLTFQGDGMRTVREIEVKKFRGSAHLYGKHLCKIDERGMNIYPRVELVLGREAYDANQDPIAVCKFSIPKLDRLLGGGVPTGTTTALLGAAGTGKTWLGVRFLEAGAKVGEKSLYLGFYETPERLMRKMKKMGTNLEPRLKDGSLRLLWQAPTEHMVDEIIVKLISEVREHKIRRVFIDGIGGIVTSMLDSNRLHPALVALMNELRRHEVAVLFTEETDLFTSEARTPISDQSAVTDNIIYLRHIDLEGKLRRVLSVVKSREMSIGHEILEMCLTAEGMVIDGPIENADGLFNGTPRLHEKRHVVLKSSRPTRTTGNARRKKRK